MESKAHLERLVDRYLDNRATAEELEVFVYLQKQGVLDQLLEDRLTRRLCEEPPLRSPRQRKWMLPLAATATLMLVSSMGLYFSWGYLQSLIEPVARVEVSTGKGEIKSIQMADGSLVTLNANSAIRFSNDGAEKERVVELTRGEAFFEVKKKPDKRVFIVKTPTGLEIKVMGTAFNVSEKAGQMHVFLQEGKVQLRTSKETARLTPGELATIGADRKRIDIRTVAEDQWLAWKNNLFVFEDAPLEEVARELEAYYGITVELPKMSPEPLRFTGKMERDNLDTVLNVIGETLNLKNSRKGAIVKFQL